jgi:hypothetical protein
LVLLAAEKATSGTLLLLIRIGTASKEATTSGLLVGVAGVPKEATACRVGVAGTETGVPGRTKPSVGRSGRVAEQSSSGLVLLVARAEEAATTSIAAAKSGPSVGIGSSTESAASIGPEPRTLLILVAAKQASTGRLGTEKTAASGTGVRAETSARGLPEASSRIGVCVARAKQPTTGGVAGGGIVASPE